MSRGIINLVNRRQRRVPLQVPSLPLADQARVAVHTFSRVDSDATPLELRDDGLWAYVKFLPEVAEDIQSKRVRFCSATLIFDTVDRETGKPLSADLHSIALTNTPFVDGLTPLDQTVGENGEGWIHVSKPGLIAGHPSGRKEIKLEHLQSVLKARAGKKTPLHIDAHHHSVNPQPGTRPQALGWVELENKTGNKMPCNHDELIGQIALLLGLGEESELDTEVVLSKIKALLPAKSEASSEEAPAEDVVENSVTVNAAEAPAEASPEAASEAMKMLMSALGADEAGVLAFLKENVDALSAMAGSKPADGGPAEEAAAEPAAAPMSYVVTGQAVLMSRLEAATKELECYRESEKKRVVSEAIASGRATENERAALESLYGQNKALFEQLTNARTVVPLSRQSDSEPARRADLSEAESQAVSRMTRGGIKADEAMRLVLAVRK